jgi:signal transduction histidine kinase
MHVGIRLDTEETVVSRHLGDGIGMMLKGLREETLRELPPETAYRARLLYTLGLLVFLTGLIVTAAQLLFWVHPTFPPPPGNDLLVDAMAMMAGAFTLWLVYSSRLRPAAWTVIGLLLLASTIQFFIEGRPVTDIAGRSGLLVTVALAFVLLERRGAWIVLTLSVVIFVSMHALWWGGYLPQAVSRDRFTQLTFSVVVWTTSTTIMAALVYSAIRTLRDWARDLRERVKELTLLHETSKTITRLLDMDTVLEVAVQSLHQRFGYHSVAILSLDDGQETLHLRALVGRLADLVPRDHSQTLDEGLLGWTARHAETVLVNDVETDPRYVSHYPQQIDTQSEICVPIRIGENVMGVLDVQSDQPNAFDDSDVRVLETLAGQIAGAMENARLYQAERDAHQQVHELATYLQSSHEEERTHIAREILDEFGQLMTALQLDLSRLTNELPDDQPGLTEKVSSMSAVIDQSLQVVRRLASQLRPGVLDHFGLAAAVRWQAEAFSEESDITHRLHLHGEMDTLDREVSTALFRILQEALSNVEAHAEATEVRIDLHVDPERAALMVADNGRGIKPEETTGSASLGLAGMRQRAEALGGHVDIEGLPEQGTRVTAFIPRRSSSPHS